MRTAARVPELVLLRLGPTDADLDRPSRLLTLGPAALRPQGTTTGSPERNKPA